MKKMSTKIMAATLALMIAASMAACGNSSSSSSSVPPSSTPDSSMSPSSGTASSLPETSTPEAGEYDANAMLYYNAITGARDTESNDAFGVFTHDTAYNLQNWNSTYGELKNDDGTAYTEEQLTARHNEDRDMWLQLLGLTSADVENYAISVSPMNIKAYGVAVIKPVAGKEETVKAGLENFVATQQKNFENYLPDQYEIAKAGKVEQLEDGTLIMVVGENQDALYESISKGLTAK